MSQSNTSDYQFEMFDLRRRVLAGIAECARNDDIHSAKFDAARLIRTHAKGDAEKAAKAFKTSFDRALETVRGTSEYEIDIEEFPADGILTADDHDAEIDPTREIDGDVAEIITSTKKEGWSEEETVYPIVAHPSGFRVCTCGAQKYYIVCPHTLARVIERNWTKAAVPA